MYKDKDIRLV